MLIGYSAVRTSRRTALGPTCHSYSASKCLNRLALLVDTPVVSPSSSGLDPCADAMLDEARHHCRSGGTDTS